MRPGTKNKRIRKLLFEEQMTITDLAKVLGLSLGETSTMLKYELAKTEQDEIIRRIKDGRSETYAG